MKLYKSLIRPHMEYACLVWDLQLRKDIQALENVQKFALRVCSKSCSSNYDTLLDTLCIQSLSDWRETRKLCLLFNILIGRVIYLSCSIWLKTLPILPGIETPFNLWYPSPTNTNIHSYHRQLRDGTVLTLIQMAVTL